MASIFRCQQTKVDRFAGFSTGACEANAPTVLARDPPDFFGAFRDEGSSRASQNETQVRLRKIPSRGSAHAPE